MASSQEPTSIAARTLPVAHRVARRDWYVGIAIVAAALIFHALFPRYEIRHPGGDRRPLMMLRVDRWTGKVWWVQPGGAFYAR
jgi:hypothetical protein